MISHYKYPSMATICRPLLHSSSACLLPLASSLLLFGPLQSACYLLTSLKQRSIIYLCPAMRFTATITALVAATLTQRANAWATCGYGPDGGFIINEWEISASGVPDIPGVCGGLWDNMKRFADCIGISAPNCYDNGDGTLEWQFNVGVSCNAGMVESAWWEATQNQWGAIECEQGDQT
jgi:hypothetical protein